jgi:hypothetical protein
MTVMDRALSYLRDCESGLHGVASSKYVRICMDGLARNPPDPIPFYRLATTCRAHALDALWARGVDIALGLPHETYEALFQRALARILLGNWAGWTDFEARLFHPGWTCAQSTMFTWRSVRWDGCEDLSQSTLLIITEGGFGDAIFVLRFVQAMARRVGRLAWTLRPELADFARHNLDGMVDILFTERDVSNIDADRYLWSLSLPHVVGCRPPFAALSATAPITHRRRSEGRRRMGICWATGTGGDHQPGRSVPLSELSRLFANETVEWHSLQVGESANECHEYPDLIQPQPTLSTFADTANLIASLDCVITVDSAVGHLAGSLNVPTFLVLRYASDFKWGLGDRTSWYPSMTLVRQPSPGDWAGAIDMLISAIEQEAPRAS